MRKNGKSATYGKDGSSDRSAVELTRMVKNSTYGRDESSNRGAVELARMVKMPRMVWKGRVVKWSWQSVALF